MAFLSIAVGILLLLVLVTLLKVDTFISFMLVCIFLAIVEGLPLPLAVEAIQRGIGNTMGSLMIILGLGAMLGKLVADSGAAREITDRMVSTFGKKRIQFALMVTGFIVGIPMFYSVGFVILVPLVFTIAASTGLPLLYIGLPMLASLSVTHGYLPPHPAPTAIAEMFEADLGITLIYGFIVAIPAILTARYLMSGSMKKINAQPLKEFVQPEPDVHFSRPGTGISFLIALMPVILIGGSSATLLLTGPNRIIEAIGNPAIAMLLSVILASYFLGFRTGRSTRQVTAIVSSSVQGIAMILFVIAGAGALKEILLETGISDRIGQSLSSLGMSPILLAWIVAALMRICIGSATVAGLTAASILLPLIGTTGTSPELLVLAIGAGSIMLGHVNDSGFWLFKEYFSLSVRDTLRSWTLMESIVSVMGLLGVLVLNLFV